MGHKSKIYIEIQKLQQRLGKEYEKCMENGFVDDYVIKLSQNLDVLINKYFKIDRSPD